MYYLFCSKDHLFLFPHLYLWKKMGVWGCGLGTELDSYDLSHAWMLESFGEAHMTGLGSGILIIETDNVHQASHHLRILATKKSHVSLSVLMALIQVKSLITRSTVSFFFFFC